MKALTNLKRNKNRQIKAQCPAKTRAIYKPAHADTNQPGWAPKDEFSLSRLLIRQWEKTSSVISARFTRTVRTHPSPQHLTHTAGTTPDTSLLHVGQPGHKYRQTEMSFNHCNQTAVKYLYKML